MKHNNYRNWNEIPDTSDLVKKTSFDLDITEVKTKIPGIISLGDTAALNKKAIKIEKRIADITNLTTKPALNTKATELENEIPDFTNLATKIALKIKITRKWKRNTWCYWFHMLLMLLDLYNSLV